MLKKDEDANVFNINVSSFSTGWRLLQQENVSLLVVIIISKIIVDENAFLLIVSKFESFTIYTLVRCWHS